MPSRGMRWRRTRCLGGRLCRGLLRPALTRIRRRVDLPIFDALSFAQQLAEMGVVGPCVPGACQVNHICRQGIGSCVGRPAAPMTVGEGGCASFPVNRQHAPGVAWADTHQRSGLVQRHMLRQQAVQNLKSRLFFGGHCHILHRGNVTFMLAS